MQGTDAGDGGAAGLAGLVERHGLSRDEIRAILGVDAYEMEDWYPPRGGIDEERAPYAALALLLLYVGEASAEDFRRDAKRRAAAARGGDRA